MTTDPTIGHTDLQALALRARSGDVASLETLLSASQPDLRRFAARNCGTGQDAEDAVQHALLVIYTKIGSFRAASKFTTWVFAIVRNECSRLRRVATREWDSRTDPVDVADAVNQFSELDQVELLQLLAQPIADLPAPLREVFVLREVEGYNTAQVAAKLGLSEGNVKVRLHRARQRLRVSLQSSR